MERKPIIISILLMLLMMSGCNLTVSITGEGEVSNRLSSFSCDEGTCKRSNNGNPKRFELIANPANGYTNIGLLASNGNLYRGTDGYYVFTEIGFLAFAPDVGTRTGQGYPSASSATQEQSVEPTYMPPVALQVFSENIEAIFVPSDDIAEIYQGHNARCVQFNDESIECWGSNFDGAPGDFTNIYRVENNHDAICVADDNGLRCWGDNYYGLADEPEGIHNVVDIAFARNKACAVYEGSEGNQLACWGRSAAQIPAVDNPTSVRGYSDLPELMCVTSNGEETCWGEEYFGQAQVPENLTNVSDFSVGDTYTCAIADGEVVCWGWGYDEIPDGISNPTSISTERYGTCVTDDSGLNCWGYSGTELPSLAGAPIAVDVSRNAICVQDSTTLRCNTVSSGEFIYTYNNLKQFDTDGSACYLDNNGAACIGNDFRNDILQQLINPQAFAMAHGVLCHYSDAGVGCTAKSSFFNPHDDVPSLEITPTGLVIGFYGACAYENDLVADNSAFQCWGYGVEEPWTIHNRGQYTPPEDVGMFSKVESGTYHTCGLSGSQLYCWGEENPPVESSE